MSDILMTNIFFMITAISSVVITLILIILLVYLIRLVRKIHHIAYQVDEETSRVVKDVEDLRVSLRGSISTAKNIMSAHFVQNLVEKLINNKSKK